jgi:hypothetical protein
MKALLATLLCLTALPALAQTINMQAGPNGVGMQVDVPPDDAQPQADVQVNTRATSTYEERGNGYKLVYKTNSGGYTVMEVVEPRGASCEVYDGETLVAREDIPMSVNAQSDRWYRFIVRMPNGAVWEKKLATKRGMTGSLFLHGGGGRVTVNTAPPPPPQPVAYGMSDSDFEGLKGAIENASFSKDKIGVLRTAAGSAAFTAHQVGELIDLYSFSKDKLDALGIVRGKIVDRQNNFHILEHFTFSSDKQKAQGMLQ